MKNAQRTLHSKSDLVYTYLLNRIPPNNGQLETLPSILTEKLLNQVDHACLKPLVEVFVELWPKFFINPQLSPKFLQIAILWSKCKKNPDLIFGAFSTKIGALIFQDNFFANVDFLENFLNLALDALKHAPQTKNLIDAILKAQFNPVYNDKILQFLQKVPKDAFLDFSDEICSYCELALQYEDQNVRLSILDYYCSLLSGKIVSEKVLKVHFGKCVALQRVVSELVEIQSVNFCKTQLAMAIFIWPHLPPKNDVNWAGIIDFLLSTESGTDWTFDHVISILFLIRTAKIAKIDAKMICAEWENFFTILRWLFDALSINSSCLKIDVSDLTQIVCFFWTFWTNCSRISPT